MRARVPYGSPWLTIWTQPRGTIRGIVDSDPNQCLLLLASLSGIGVILNYLFQTHAGNYFNSLEIMFIACIAGPVLGILGLYGMGLLIRLTGSWLGGVATSEEVHAALAWAGVPRTVTVLAQFFGLIVCGNDLYKVSGYQVIDPRHRLILAATAISMVVLGIWQFILCCKCVAEVHRFSAWRGLRAMLMAHAMVSGVLLTTITLAITATRAIRAWP